MGFSRQLDLRLEDPLVRSTGPGCLLGCSRGRRRVDVVGAVEEEEEEEEEEEWGVVCDVSLGLGLGRLTRECLMELMGWDQRQRRTVWCRRVVDWVGRFGFGFQVGIGIVERVVAVAVAVRVRGPVAGISGGLSGRRGRGRRGRSRGKTFRLLGFVAGSGKTLCAG